MIGSVIGWIVFGMIAGGIARALYPGPNPMGLFLTMILGIVGSLVGGGLAFVLRIGTYPYNPAGWIFSIVGAIILLSLGFFGSKAGKKTSSLT